jgi:hypothetical protein
MQYPACLNLQTSMQGEGTFILVDVFAGFRESVARSLAWDQA